jgi:hypothetical protein
MTNQIETDADQVDPAFAVVEAFLDGERVDAQTLKHALADADAREHFVDLLALREAVGSMAPGAWSADGRAGARPHVRWFAAAAAVVLSLTAGYFAGQRAVASTEPPASSVQAVIQFERPPAAPAPTQVISLRPGINWTENSGGR